MRWVQCGNCEWHQHGVASRERCMCSCHPWQGKGRRRRKPRSDRNNGRGRVVRLLLERDGDRCCWCGVKLKHPWLPTIEHWEPRYLGGGNNLENLRLACAWCNQKRGIMDPDEFLVWLESHWVPVESRAVRAM